MPRGVTQSSAASQAVILAAVVLAVAALYLARDVLIPFTLAVFLAFLLNPLVNRVQRWGVPRIIAVVMVCAAALAVLVALAIGLAFQMADLVESLPGYLENAQRQLEPLWRPVYAFGQRMISNVEAFAGEAANGAATATTPAPAPTTAPAAPAESAIMQMVGQLGFVTAAFETVGAPMATFSIVVVLAAAMMFQGNDLRDRFVRLIGDSQLTVTTRALDDVSSRVSRYLITQTAINGGLGTVVAIALTILGVPNALLWGLLWAILRFLPYVGPWIGAIMPIVTSLGVAEGWAGPLLTAAVMITVELTSNVVLEPWLYGSGTGLSPLAVLISAVFWAWLWGWVGLVLATPMTVCLAVVGRYVDALSFLNIALGDKPVLTPNVQLYQRLLSGQMDDARRIIDAQLEDSGKTHVFEKLLVPVVQRVDLDLRQDLIDSTLAATTYERLGELIDTLPQASGVVRRPGRLIMGFPARDEADHLCARMLRRLLGDHGLDLELVGAGQLSNELAEIVAQRQPAAILVSALSHSRDAHVRHIVRRVASREREVLVVVAFWSTDDPVEESALPTSFDVMVVSRFSEAAELLRLAALRAASPPAPNAAVMG